MIHELKIVDIKKSNFGYFKYPEKLNLCFKQGLNIVIGKNGTGKTTLIKILSEYTFCTKGISKIDQYSLVNLFKHDVFNNGIVVKNNFDISTFKTILEHEKSNNDILSNIKSFASNLSSKELSDGQKTLLTLQNVFGDIFESKNSIFDKDFFNLSMNDLYTKFCKQIKKYFKDNHITEKFPIFCLLMDEPDRNLDLENIKMLYDIFSNQKENGQMIITLHNPILIYKLSKLKDVNIIELSEDYLNSIKNIIETN